MKVYNKVLAHLFFLFFTCVIFSPAVNAQTLYLYWIIPALDLSFIFSLKKIRIRKEIMIYFFCMMIILIVYKRYIEILRICLIIYSLIYLRYLYKKNYFYLLYKYMNLNILIAIFQFISGYIDPKISYMIGPTNIANAIWGKFAGGTFTNFYSIGFLKRGSGLSREVGFFASLIIIVIIIYYNDCRIQKNKIQYLIFFIGYIVGFSKMSFILPIYFILIKIRKYIDKIPLLISSNLILLGLIIISSYLNHIGYFNLESQVTWIHRLGGYFIITQYKIKNFMYFFKDIAEIYQSFPIFYLKYVLWLKYFTGLSHLILHMGILIYILFLMILKTYKITTFQYLILVLLCLNTSFVTVTSYIVLNYYYIIYLQKK